MPETEPLVKLRHLAVEAANALWALDHGKKPERGLIAINQDIYHLLPQIDRMLEIGPPSARS